MDASERFRDAVIRFHRGVCNIVIPGYALFAMPHDRFQG